MIKRLFISFFLLTLVCPARADHSAGGELVYEWIRDSTYRFYLKFYRDCEGIPVKDTLYMCFFNSCNSYNGSVPMTQVPSVPGGFLNGAEVNPGCPGVLTTCSSTSPGVLPGYREWWYSAVVTVPSRCDYWTFYVSSNARNRMDNLSSTIFQNLYLEATMNNRDAQGFSAPYFTVKPVPYVCVNEPHVYSNGPVDPDGDSLSFEFITPRTSAGPSGSGISAATRYCPGSYNATNCTYTPPFSIANPFATSNTFTFDQLTGLMRFTPAALSVNTLTVRVNKWRNGKKLASVIRDIQLRVITCSTPPVALDIIQSSVQGSRYINDRIEACAGAPFSFCFNLSAGVATARLLGSDNHAHAIPGSGVSYSNQGTNRVMGCFSWQPPATADGLYLLAVTVKDSACNAPGVMVPQTFIIPIFIKPVIRSYLERQICLGDTLQLASNGDQQIVWSVLPGGGSVSSLSCTTCKYPVARPDTTTTYIASYNTSNACADGDTVVVQVMNNRISVMPPGPVIFCAPDSIQLSAQAGGPRPYINLPCGTATIPAPGIPRDTVAVALPGVPRDSAVNNPGSTPFNGSYTTARHQYLLRAADMQASGLRSGTLTGLSVAVRSRTGSAATFDHFRIALSCTGQEFDAAGNFFPGTVPVYTAPGPVTIPASGGVLDFDFDVPYNWDTTQHLVVDLCYANAAAVPAVYTPYYPAGYNATLYSYHITGNICAGDPSLSGGILLSQLPDIRLHYAPAPEGDFAYTWGSMGGTVFYPDTTGQHTSARVSQSTRIYVRSEGRGGCIVSDTVTIYIPEHNYGIINDTVICAGNSVRLYAGPGYSYRWYQDGFAPPATLSCADCSAPAATPASDVTYTVVITDSVGCADTLSVTIRVNPVPDVRILNNDTTIGYGESVQLLATGADHYLWSPGAGLSNAGIADPVARPEADIKYVVRGHAEGCHAEDTVRIYVDAKGRVDIPSAFTPNGDGKNDVFRLANITFQQVPEFRVFNRWGEEVFSTIDPRGGWDGTWKGKPQETGVYFYLIRVAYPDGRMDTYRGDVTLIR